MATVLADGGASSRFSSGARLNIEPLLRTLVHDFSQPQPITSRSIIHFCHNLSLSLYFNSFAPFTSSPSHGVSAGIFGRAYAWNLRRKNSTRTSWIMLQRALEPLGFAKLSEALRRLQLRSLPKNWGSSRPLLLPKNKNYLHLQTKHSESSEHCPSPDDQWSKMLVCRPCVCVCLLLWANSWHDMA